MRKQLFIGINWNVKMQNSAVTNHSNIAFKFSCSGMKLSLPYSDAFIENFGITLSYLRLYILAIYILRNKGSVLSPYF